MSVWTGLYTVEQRLFATNTRCGWSQWVAVYVHASEMFVKGNHALRLQHTPYVSQKKYTTEFFLNFVKYWSIFSKFFHHHT